MVNIFRKKQFRNHGGTALPHCKRTKHNISIIMPPSEKVVIPMQQHIGVPCKPVVKKGDYVRVGQLIGDSDAYVSAPIHASISGNVTEIKELTMPNGKITEAVVIASDGLMEIDDDSCRPPQPVETKADLVDAARNAGLVGLGGAGFPTHCKLNISAEQTIDTLIVNAAECEPYVNSDHREAFENTQNVLNGINTVKKILKIDSVIIAVEDNKPEVIRHLQQNVADCKYDFGDAVRVMSLKSYYPQGAEKVLIRSCTGRRVPPGKLPQDIGCLVMNISTIAYLAYYLQTGIPLVRKRVTVDGSAIVYPQNLIVPIGTPVKELLKFCCCTARPKKVLFGGPMMGIAIADTEMPVIKQNNAVLAFNEKDAVFRDPTDCIRCGRCVAGCPMNLMPVKIENAAMKKDIAALKSLNAMLCMECGCCSFNCPAARGLVQSIHLGKSYLRHSEEKANG